MQARGRLVEDKERAPGIALGKLGGELHALVLAARQRGRRLSEFDIAQADVLQHLDFLVDAGYSGEELASLVDGHVEHVGNRLALEAHLEGLAVVAFAVALLAGDEHVGQEVHLDGLVAVALACLASATGHVEAEPPRLVASDFGLWKCYEEIADVGKDARICRRVRPWRPPERRLVYGDDLVDIFDALDAAIGQRLLERTVEMLAQYGLKCAVDERRFARARHAGNHCECAELEG